MNFKKVRFVLLIVLVALCIISCNNEPKVEKTSEKSSKPAQAAVAKKASESVATPFGIFKKEHVHQHPSGSVISKNKDGSATVLYPDGKTRQIAKIEGYAIKTPAANQLPIGHAWLNYASFYTASGVEVGTFNAKYKVPGNPTKDDGQTLYYFIGVQDNGSSPLTILQPVLGYNGNGASGWSISSWNCCPAGQPHQSNTISGIQPGDIITTSMQKTGSGAYTITATWNGQSATLVVNTGSEFFNWPNVTLEVYNISSCDEFAVGPIEFFDLELLDTNGNPIPMNWTITGNGSVCNTRVTVVSPTEITIQEN